MHPTKPSVIFYNRLLCFSLLLALFSSNPLNAQTDTLGNPDAAFVIAKNLAFSGKREEGRQLALRLLEKYPHYHDIRTFVGRSYAWDGDYEKARQAFSEVATANAQTPDNYLAWTDAERWAATSSTGATKR